VNDHKNYGNRKDRQNIRLGRNRDNSHILSMDHNNRELSNPSHTNPNNTDRNYNPLKIHEMDNIPKGIFYSYGTRHHSSYRY
jgi:hypothetical protein